MDNIERLAVLLANMDIPEQKRQPENLKRMETLRWLSRNIQFRNSENPGFEEACNLIRNLLKNSAG